MENHPVPLYHLPELSGKTGRALVACGLWMRLGFIGGCAVAVGMIQLFRDDASPLSSLALAVGGAAVAAFSWRRAHAALGVADGPITPTPAAVVPAPAPASGGIRTVVGA
jgi:hypothetical protein